MIDTNEVIERYGITNISNPVDYGVNTATGRRIDYTQSNYDWVDSQVNYFNSNFTDISAWHTFCQIVQSWYYNYGFKKFYKYHLPNNTKLEMIYSWSIEVLAHFLTVYKRRINAIQTLRGIETHSRSEYWHRVYNRNPQTEEEEFDCVFQSRIGSLSCYCIGIPFNHGIYDSEGVSLEAAYYNDGGTE